MGKSPGKWIKTVLFGKKSSKYNTGKGREKTGNEREVLVAAKTSEADAALVPSVVSRPTLSASDRAERKFQLDGNETANLVQDGGAILPGNQDLNSQGSLLQPPDPDKERKDRAATVAQAAFRGYLARRAFQALKGIIRLQALIRGHLVRRQAIVTLSCVLGIVKLQALARGRKVRDSDIGQEVHKICSLVKPLEGKDVDSNAANISIRKAKLSANAFVRKLVTSSPTVMPLRLHYESADSNSVSTWLERWTASHFWTPLPQPKKIPHCKTQRKQGSGPMGETETGRPKRSVRRVPAANVDSSSANVTAEFEKSKRSFRKVLSHPADTVQENPQHELEKVKRNLRKVHNPIVENSVQLGVEIEKPKQTLEETSGTLGDTVLGQSTSNSGEKIKKETTPTTSKLSAVVKNEPTLTASKLPDVKNEPTLASTLPGVETTLEPLEMNEASGLADGGQAIMEPKPSVESGVKDENTPTTNGELNSSHKEDSTNKENHKSGRKASIIAKQERAENGLQNSPTLPSYMVATESAKAKLRVQGSPRFGQDGVEKNNVTRRHSLPSSTNSKISSQSPRTQRAVNHSGKGNKSDRALLSSRDGNAKGVQVEWRR